MSRPGQQNGELAKGVCRGIGAAENTYYRWKATYGGMSVCDARRLRELEVENRHLKTAVAELTLDKQALKDVLSRNTLRPRPGERRWSEPGSLWSERETSLRPGKHHPVHVSLLTEDQPDESMVDDETARAGDAEAPVRLSAAALLGAQGGRRINHKRVYRVYTKLELARSSKEAEVNRTAHWGMVPQ